MLLLSAVGCPLFLSLGLLDASGCEELRRQEAELDGLMWFKLLFVPTLGIVILTLFLLEDHCYGYGEASRRAAVAAARDAGDAGDDDDAGLNAAELSVKAKRQRANSSSWRLLDSCHAEPPVKGRMRSQSSSSRLQQQQHFANCSDACCADSCEGHHSSRLSTSSRFAAHSLSVSCASSSSSSSSSCAQVLLLSESEQPTAYTLPPSLPLRDLLTFHASRHNLTLDPCIVYVDGHRVEPARVSDAVERAGVRDGSVLRVEQDWRRMVELLIRDEDREGKDLEKELQLVRRDRVEKQDRVGKMETELRALRAEEEAETERHRQAERERDDVVSQVRAEEAELEAARSARRDAEETRRKRERESGTEREKREKARLVELIARTKRETAELSRERGELSLRIRRVREENEEMAGRRRELAVKADRIEREKEGWRRKVEAGEKAVLERLERAEREKEDSARMKAKMELSEREKDERRQAREDAHRSVIARMEQIDRELAKQQQRLKAAEKEAAEAVKYRQLSRQYEADVKESVRWKLIVKQSRVRERIMEKEGKELVHWRQRAKAFEREVKQLRQWKREVARRERRAAEEAGGGIQGGAGGMAGWSDFAGFEYGGDAMLDGLNGSGGYDAADDWRVDGGLLGDELLDDEDDATIPPVDLIASSAAFSAVSSSGAASLGRSFAAVNSTLQPTAAPFVPRLNLTMPATVSPPPGSASSVSITSSTSSSPLTSSAASSPSSSASAPAFSVHPFFSSFPHWTTTANGGAATGFADVSGGAEVGRAGGAALPLFADEQTLFRSAMPSMAVESEQQASRDQQEALTAASGKGAAASRPPSLTLSVHSHAQQS